MEVGTEIARIYVTVGAELEQFQRGMSAAQKTLSQVSSKFNTAGKLLTRNLTMPLVALGVASIAASKNMKGMDIALTNLKVPLTSMANSVAAMLLPAMGSLTEILNTLAASLRSFVNYLHQADPATRGLVAGALMLAVGLGPVLKSLSFFTKIIQWMIGAVQLLTGAFGAWLAALTAIGVVVAWAGINFKNLMATYNAVYYTLAAMAYETAYKIADAFGKAYSWIPGVKTAIIGVKKEIWDMYMTAEEKASASTKAANAKWMTLGEMFGAAKDKMMNGLSALGGAIGTTIPAQISLLDTAIKDFATDFGQRVGGAFQVFTKGTFDIVGAFSSAIDAMVGKMIASGVMNMIGNLLQIPGMGTWSGGANPGKSNTFLGDIPVVGNVLKSIPLLGGFFDKGGIVPGNSFTGDKVLARVNSGEQILTKDQQKSKGPTSIVYSPSFAFGSKHEGIKATRMMADMFKKRGLA